MEPAAVLLECHTGIHIDMGSARASRVVYRSLLKNAVVAVRVSLNDTVFFHFKQAVFW